MKGSSSFLTQSLAAELRKGIALIEHLSDEIYTARPDNMGSVGTHFRHNLDFGTNLLLGVETAHLDYGRRERDLKVETDRDFAIERLADLAVSISGIPEDKAGAAVLVRSEVDEELWAESSVARELEFVHSHTVHHHALIAAKLGGMGIELSKEFGVAPSTLRYWKTSRTKPANA